MAGTDHATAGELVTTWVMSIEPIASFEPVFITVRWPAFALMELVAVSSGVWAWRSEDGSWFTLRAATA